VDVHELSVKLQHLCPDEDIRAALLPERDAAEMQPLPIDSSWTQEELRRHGFEYPRPSSQWFGKFIQHAIEVGFIEAPRYWNVGAMVTSLL
jgi:hypothetical protein